MSHNLITSLEIGAVLCINALAFIITLSGITDCLKLISIILAIGYTAWKWITEYKKESKIKGKRK